MLKNRYGTNHGQVVLCKENFTNKYSSLKSIKRHFEKSVADSLAEIVLAHLSFSSVMTCLCITCPRVSTQPVFVRGSIPPLAPSSGFPLPAPAFSGSYYRSQETVVCRRAEVKLNE